MRYLVDTNILIDHLRGDTVCTEFLQKVEQGIYRASISVITEYELLVGPKPGTPETLRIIQLLQLLPRISVTSHIVRTAAEFRQRYHTDTVDSLIAATAYRTKATLVTRNLKHFNSIPEIQTQSLP